MTIYTPDAWVIVKIYSPKHGAHYRVLAGWYGGFTGCDVWRMNSGIVAIKEYEKYYDFVGDSGSSYKCHKNEEKTTSLTQSVFMGYAEQLENLKDGSYMKQVEVKDIPLEIQKF